jgi:hypothetical protein
MADDQIDESVNTNANHISNSKVKKPFEPPRLTVYGDIATLTRTVGRTGNNDGGHSAPNKTSL